MCRCGAGVRKAGSVWHGVAGMAKGEGEGLAGMVLEGEGQGYKGHGKGGAKAKFSSLPPASHFQRFWEIVEGMPKSNPPGRRRERQG